MILADKIINERKKNGWSQEELAEMLSVSRQSVSKWESAQAVPDIQKIITMAEIFGVSTDYLLKDDMEPETAAEVKTVHVESNNENIRRVSFEEANEFLEISKNVAPKIANAVSLCIISPITIILLSTMAESKRYGITDTVAVALGLIALLAFVSIAVYIFIVCGSGTKKFEYLEKEAIETVYGVDGMVQEKMKSMEAKKTSNMALGVILCILSCVPLLVTACLEMEELVIVGALCVLLLIVAVAVNMFVRTGIVWGSFEKLLEQGDYTQANKRVGKKIEKIAGIYWSIAVAGYLGWSFVTMRWDYTWIVWPVAALIFGAVVCMIKAFSKED